MQLAIPRKGLVAPGAVDGDAEQFCVIPWNSGKISL